MDKKVLREYMYWLKVSNKNKIVVLFSWFFIVYVYCIVFFGIDYKRVLFYV